MFKRIKPKKRNLPEAIGCSLLISAVPTIANNLTIEQIFSLTNKQIFVTAGTPLVKVPVLSNTIDFTLCAFSSGSEPLMRIPFRAPTPVPTMTAVGVANPKAQGQAIAKTDNAHLKAY